MIDVTGPIELISPDGRTVCGIDGATGSLVSLRSGEDGWAVLAGARAARPFDLLIPRPERRLNRRQKA